MRLKLVAAAVGAVGFCGLGSQPAAAASFDTWSVRSSYGFFDNGPSLAVTPGSNALGINFAAQVFAPGSPIDNFQSSGCTTNAGGACVGPFYYTLPLDIRVGSPLFQLTAGDHYTLQFAVFSSDFTSSADMHVETPYVQLDYFNSFSSNALALVPTTPGVFSTDFIAPASEMGGFEFIIARGRNADGVDSSSDSVFTETGSYVFANFSVTDLSAPPFTAAIPEPSTWALLLIGFVGLGFRRYRVVAARP